MKKISTTMLIAGALYTTAWAQKLEEVVSFGKYQPIGVSVSKQRLFVGFPHREPFLYGLTEIVKGERLPYPSKEWNQFNPDQSDKHFVNVQDLYTDDQNQLWVLDSAPRGGAAILESTSKEGQFKLIQIDLASNRVKRIYSFDDLHKEKSALNDVCVDTKRQLAYLSDPGLHALIVLDLRTGKSRQVLTDDVSTKAQDGFKLHLDGKDVVDEQGKPFVSNVNGIALTLDHKYFYFRAINQTKLYRIETQYLANASLTDEQLRQHVETVAETGVCHGMIADAKGNIYQTTSPQQAITYVSPDGKQHTLVEDARLIWPDSLGISSDGYLYFSCSQINRLPKYNHGVDKTEYPYRVYRVKLP
ncbi:MAG: L-dopachrome tautomerase-related protein [Siphonobacter sp.]